MMFEHLMFVLLQDMTPSWSLIIFPTGPYMFGTGLIIYLLSKEIYVINHETIAAVSIGTAIIYGVKKFGPSFAAFVDKLNEVSWNGRKQSTDNL